MKLTRIIFALAALTTGCASVPEPPVPDGHGLLYVSWMSALPISAIDAMFQVPGIPTVTLSARDCRILALPQGRYTVTQTWKAGLLGNKNFEGKPLALPIEVRANSVTHVRLQQEPATTAVVAGRQQITHRWRISTLSPDEQANSPLACKRITSLP